MSFSIDVLDIWVSYTLAIPLVFPCVCTMPCRILQCRIVTIVLLHFLFVSPVRKRGGQCIQSRDWHHRVFKFSRREKESTNEGVLSRSPCVRHVGLLVPEGVFCVWE
jgi:hypothetical protein